MFGVVFLPKSIKDRAVLVSGGQDLPLTTCSGKPNKLGSLLMERLFDGLVEELSGESSGYPLCVCIEECLSGTAYGSGVLYSRDPSSRFRH